MKSAMIFVAVFLIALSFPALAGTWFNTSYGQCVNFTLSEIKGFARLEEPRSEILNLTNTNVLPSGIDIRLVNQSCRNGGSEIDYDIYKIDGKVFTLRFLANLSANTSNVFAVYVNNSAATNITRQTDFVFSQSGVFTSVENNHYNLSFTRSAIDIYRIRNSGIDGSQLVGANNFGSVFVNATTTINTGIGSCTKVANGSLYLELNCTVNQISVLYTFWSRKPYFDLHLSDPTRDEALSIHFRYSNVTPTQVIFAYNVSRDSGGAAQGNVSVRGLLGEWSDDQSELTGLLYNTSEHIESQTEFETFSNAGDATLFCAGIGCNVAAPYTSNGSYLYDTKFRFINGVTFPDNSSKIGYLETEWEKFMSSPVAAFGSTENQIIPVPLTTPVPTILQPTNITYSSTSRSLEVTANESFDKFWYILNGGVNITFAPNTTFTAVSGSNTITVYVNGTSGTVQSAALSFTVTVPVSLTGKVTGATGLAFAVIPAFFGLAIILFGLYSIKTSRNHEDTVKAMVIMFVGVILLLVTAGLVASAL